MRSDLESSSSSRTHVTSIRRGAIHCLRSHMTPPSKDLGHDSILHHPAIEIQLRPAHIWKHGSYLEVRKRHTMFRIMRLAQEQIPQPKPPRLDLQLFNDRNDSLPSAFALRKLVVSDFLGGDDFFLETSGSRGYMGLHASW